jgi:DNA-binding NarL/FixJ family response regulator
MNRVRVLIADDHAMVRTGLAALIQAQPDLEVVGEAEDGVRVVERCRELRPDVVVLDLSMPVRGGLPALEELRAECPATRTVVLTMHDDEAYVRLARLAGADGFVLKKALATELIRALRAVAAGRTHFPGQPPAAPRLRREGTPMDRLTPREREVLGLIALGHTTPEIARKLHLGEKTIETHRAHLTEKLGLHTRADLVRFALTHGLLEA